MLPVPVLLALLGTAFATPLSTSSGPHPAASRPFTLAPMFYPEAVHGAIDNSYIVMLKKDTSPTDLLYHHDFVNAAHTEHPLVADDEDSFFGGVRHVFNSHLKGYAGSFSQQTIEKLRTRPEVDYIEQDQIVRISEVQKGAPWGLARISHQSRLNFSTFTKYEYDTDAGIGVDVYVVDTGINIDHAEFEGRAKWGKTIPLNDVDEDGNGHGTHCAGTIASRKYGVAKGANVIAVKVLGSNGSGSMSDVVAGVMWASDAAAEKDAAARAEYAATGNTTHKGSVANMSLGGGKSRALDDAVNGAVDRGLHFAVAAGNDNRDACNYSPAAAEKAVTVGASTLSDEMAYFSNHGNCVDIFAPGLNILSTWVGSKTAVNTISGTSMASPHIAGLLAYLLSIYPSVTFDPSTDGAASSSQFPFPISPLPLQDTMTMDIAASNPILGPFIRIARAFISRFIKREGVTELVNGQVAAAPIPPTMPTLTPAQLKKALISLGSKDMLSELPAKTVNILAYNNFTAIATKGW